MRHSENFKNSFNYIIVDFLVLQYLERSDHRKDLTNVTELERKEPISCLTVAGIENQYLFGWCASVSIQLNLMSAVTKAINAEEQFAECNK